ncbi:MAG TPA: phenylalanine--tRNA ligase subunit beta [Bryobacteraceae bacterium]|jgi:phenylalanyl-tRNA synthetase beta chain|nr:phenylalanine--tRNA ligase subunit beta [Bryobacteraceae bacterium]
MKFSYNWIREYVPALDTPARQLERLITIRTAECEGIEETGGLLARACTAHVVSVEPIPGSHNVKAIVETGVYGRKVVVCGAPNCRPGMFAAYVPIGKKAIGGVESDGMLASGAELGVNRDDAGILELAGPVGAPLANCTPDSIIEIDNKSITHRPDLWGHYGMAREVAAILRQPLRDPVQPSLIPAGPASIPSPINVDIQDLDLCPRYSALVFDNVTVQPSPLWLQYRLTAIGLNPINNIVDMTNFIMSELSQPMHAFDRDLLRGDTIFIRRAHEGEYFLALNEQDYTLGPSNLVIADAQGAVALAGVIGGMDSAIVAGTSKIVLESACFNAAGVRRTSSALKLRTDASMRFEKSQDPANTVRGLARAVELLQELSPGLRLVGGLADQRKPIPPPPPILLPMAWLVRKLGKEVSPDEVRDILERLAFGVSQHTPGTFSVTVPSWRATKDVSVKDDLVEEVGRMIGYDSIEPKPPAILTTVPPANEERAFHRRVRAAFADQGFTEVYNYSFVAEADARAFGMQPADHVTVANPIAPNQSLLRMSLLPELRANVLENSKRFDTFRIFEIGREIHKQPQGLPREIPHLAAALYSKDGDGAAGLFELKRAAECLMPGAETRPTAARPYEHPARAAEIHWHGALVGRLFELHPSLGEGGTAMLDLDLTLVQAAAPKEKRYTPFRRYPSSAFDLSVVAGERELVGDLRGKLAALAGPLLQSIDYQRQYAGPPLAEGTKSVSFRLTVGSLDRTLSSEEVSEIRARLIDGMRAQGYDLRL